MIFLPCNIVISQQHNNPQRNTSVQPASIIYIRHFQRLHIHILKDQDELAYYTVASSGYKFKSFFLYSVVYRETLFLI